MGKSFLFLLIIFMSILQPIRAQVIHQSDTVILKSGSQNIAFEMTPTAYSQVNLYLYIRLNENCLFDSGEFLSFKLHNPKSTCEIKEIEFARVYLASYVENRKEGNNIIYDFDLTLWQSLLTENTNIIIDYNGEAEDLEAALKFKMEEGQAAVEVLGIYPLWQSSIDGFPYDKNGIDPSLLPSKIMDLPEKTSSAFVSILVSGKEKTKAKESAARFYFLKVNGTEIAKRSIWRDDCGLNPIFPQHRNWFNEHPNYCPGLRVNPLTHELDQSYIENKKLKIDLRFQKDIYENSGVKSYVTSAVLFALAEPSEELNVSISEIIAPNIDLWHHRYNPICGNPIILIQNNGKETVKNITINYGYNYEYDNKYRWKGELGFMEQEIVYLPALNWYFFDKHDEPETFTAHVSNVNGKGKDFIGGKRTSIMELASVFPYKLDFELQMGENAQYNGLEIFNEDGNAVFVSEEFIDNKEYKFELNLPPGCYEMIFYDTEGDGVKIKDDKSSFLKIKDNKNGIILKEFNGDFGNEIREQFMIFR